MDKIFVEVYVPALERSYDVCMPRGSVLKEICHLVSQAIAELNKEVMDLGCMRRLCEKNSGYPYNENATIKQLGLENGAELILL